MVEWCFLQGEEKLLGAFLIRDCNFKPLYGSCDKIKLWIEYCSPLPTNKFLQLLWHHLREGTVQWYKKIKPQWSNEIVRYLTRSHVTQYLEHSRTSHVNCTWLIKSPSSIVPVPLSAPCDSVFIFAILKGYTLLSLTCFYLSFLLAKR